MIEKADDLTEEWVVVVYSQDGDTQYRAPYSRFTPYRASASRFYGEPAAVREARWIKEAGDHRGRPLHPWVTETAVERLK